MSLNCFAKSRSRMKVSDVGGGGGESGPVAVTVHCLSPSFHFSNIVQNEIVVNMFYSLWLDGPVNLYSKCVTVYQIPSFQLGTVTLAGWRRVSVRAINRLASGFPNALVFCCVCAGPSCARTRPRVLAPVLAGLASVRPFRQIQPNPVVVKFFVGFSGFANMQGTRTIYN